MRYADKVALILDDDELIRSLLMELLRPFQFAAIKRAASVAEVEALGDLSKVDLCFIDWLLPGTSGLDFLYHLRRGRRGVRPDVRAVLMTARTDRQTVIKARDAGANAVVGKPFSRQIVWNAVVRAMEDARPFVVSPVYVGPDRRVRRQPVPEDRRGGSSSKSAA